MAAIPLPPIHMWPAIEPAFINGALLVGNGVSQVISPQFGYASLYDTARSGAVAHPLDANDEQLFTDLGTRDFEEVLQALRTATTVAAALHQPTAHLDARHQSIKRAHRGSARGPHPVGHDDAGASSELRGRDARVPLRLHQQLRPDRVLGLHGGVRLVRRLLLGQTPATSSTRRAPRSCPCARGCCTHTGVCISFGVGRRTLVRHTERTGALPAQRA